MEITKEGTTITGSDAKVIQWPPCPALDVFTLEKMVRY
jgi:hypothetical protein